MHTTQTVPLLSLDQLLLDPVAIRKWPYWWQPSLVIGRAPMSAVNPPLGDLYMRLGNPRGFHWTISEPPFGNIQRASLGKRKPCHWLLAGALR